MATFWPIQGFKGKNLWYIWILSREGLSFCSRGTYHRWEEKKRGEKDASWWLRRVPSTHTGHLPFFINLWRKSQWREDGIVQTVSFVRCRLHGLPKKADEICSDWHYRSSVRPQPLSANFRGPCSIVAKRPRAIRRETSKRWYSAVCWRAVRNRRRKRAEKNRTGNERRRTVGIQWLISGCRKEGRSHDAGTASCNVRYGPSGADLINVFFFFFFSFLYALSFRSTTISLILFLLRDY